MQSLLNRAVTTSPPDPQDGFWVVEFLLFMREAPAEMVGGHCGRNPSPLMPKIESTSGRPVGHNLLCWRRPPADPRRMPELGCEGVGSAIPQREKWNAVPGGYPTRPL